MIQRSKCRSASLGNAIAMAAFGLLSTASLQTAHAQEPNSWTTGANMPTAVQGPTTGIIGGLVYVSRRNHRHHHGEHQSDLQSSDQHLEDGRAHADRALRSRRRCGQ